MFIFVLFLMFRKSPEKCKRSVTNYRPFVMDLMNYIRVRTISRRRIRLFVFVFVLFLTFVGTLVVSMKPATSLRAHFSVERKTRVRTH